jgi:peroxiredoxin Q/BCP
VGVSADKQASQLKFIEKYGLTFPMIPDPERHVIDAFGVPMTLGLAAQRSTFLVAPDGHIERVWPKVSVKGHAEEVVSALRQAAGA